MIDRDAAIAAHVAGRISGGELLKVAIAWNIERLAAQLEPDVAEIARAHALLRMFEQRSGPTPASLTLQ